LPTVLDRSEIQILLKELLPPSERSYVANPALTQALYYAIERKDELAVFQLLRDRADPNRTRAPGDVSPLQQAIAVRSVKMVVFLLLAGADLESTNQMGETPIIAAVRAQLPDDIIALICELGAVVNEVDYRGKSALHHAAEVQHPEDSTIMALVGHGADLCGLDFDGRTPLHLAVSCGSVEAVRDLLDYGAHPDTKLLTGKSALHIAISRRYTTIARILCESGAALNDPYGDTSPLTMAIATSCDDIAQILIEAGADVNHTNSKGCFPLLLATTLGNQRLVELLLAHGADVDMADPLNITPLHIATQNRFSAIVRTLAQAGAPLDELDNEDVTPLAMATRAGHSDIVRVLIEYGADTRQYFEDRSLLWHAIENGHGQVAQMILQVDALDPTAPEDAFETTCLHHAARMGQDFTVDLIMRYGVEVDVCDASGYTPLLHAAAAGNMSTVRLLHGTWAANVGALTNDGDGILAVSAAHPTILRYLLDLRDDLGMNKKQRIPGDRRRAMMWGIIRRKPRPLLDVNQASRHGTTALHYAALCGQLESVKMLLQAGARECVAAEIYDSLEERRAGAKYRQGTSAGLARQKGFHEVAKVLETWRYKT